MANVITIDGPSASGKSTIGLLFAQRINYNFVDSGDIYRAGCLYLLRNALINANDKMLKEAFKSLKLRFELTHYFKRVFLNDEDVTSALTAQEITKIVPILGAKKSVRDEVREIQRNIASLGDLVISGRNTGIDIFPEATLKFFLTAPLELRAFRRFIGERKINEDVKFQDVLLETRARDENDINRLISPMRVPLEAIIVDSSSRSVEKVVDDMLIDFIRNRETEFRHLTRLERL